MGGDQAARIVRRGRDPQPSSQAQNLKSVMSTSLSSPGTSGCGSPPRSRTESRIRSLDQTVQLTVGADLVQQDRQVSIIGLRNHA